MSINRSDQKSVPPDVEDCEEKVASQEETYLEETEEELRAVLISDDRKTVEFWEVKREELEVDWEVEHHDRCEQPHPESRGSAKPRG